MNIIGVTGSSGSGKTTVSKIIEQEVNAKIIDADRISRFLTNNETEYLQAIVELFGKEILLENKKLNRKKLAKIIYNDDKARENLNELTFKYVVDEIKKELNQIKMEKIYNTIVLDVPLLFESGLNKECDFVIGVLAPESEKIRRICYRDRIQKGQAIKRLNTQLNDEFYKGHCDFVIENINYVKTSMEVIEILKKLQ